MSVLSDLGQVKYTVEVKTGKAVAELLSGGISYERNRGNSFRWNFKRALNDHSWGSLKLQKVHLLGFKVLGHHLITLKNRGGLGDSRQ